MEIDYSLRSEDLQAHLRYHVSFQRQPLTSLVAVLGVVVIVAIMLGIPFIVHLWGSSDRYFGLAYFFGLLVGALGEVFILFWWSYWMLRKNNKAKFEDKRSNWAYQDIHVILSPSQLITKSRESIEMYSWAVVWRIGLTRKHVFLSLTKTMSIVIPRRVFRDTAHCEEFVALARQYQRDCLEQKPKPTGIITSLPPEPTAIRRSDLP